MKVAILLEKRRENWKELEKLSEELRKFSRRMKPDEISRFAFLYRAACADLALADAYQLPPKTVDYLHRLVGQAHNQLYRSRKFDLASWYRILLVEVPQRLFRDRCVQVAFCLFWFTFIGSALMAYSQDNWAHDVMPTGLAEKLEEDFKNPVGGRDPAINFVMAGFYIRHNTSIGLRCFAWGLLIVPGLYETLSNALILGAAFGHMGRPDVVQGKNFFEFVTAHGPFELTAIVLAAGAGLRLGMGWLRTNGLTRRASLQRAAGTAMPLMGISMLLFFLAALIEGFLSPTAAPYSVKAATAVLSSGILMFYFVVLGFPRKAA
jgi:uncharacterized membrane protein SpoIIM required for sporulation